MKINKKNNFKRVSAIIMILCTLLVGNFTFTQIAYARGNVINRSTGGATDGGSDGYTTWAIGTIKKMDMGMYSGFLKDMSDVSSVVFAAVIGSAVASAVGDKKNVKNSVCQGISAGIQWVLKNKVVNYLKSGQTTYVQSVVSRKYLGNNKYSYQIVNYAFSDSNGHNVLYSKVDYQTLSA